MSKQDAPPILETEWSHFVNVETLGHGTTKLTISPDDAARGRLAQRLGVETLNTLTANIKISRGAGQATFHITGKTKAQVTQNCVVTMAPVENDVSDEFEAWFADPDAAISINKARHEQQTKKGAGEQPILEEHDDPEPIIDGKMDLGEVVTQYLCLSIEPYPHAEGAEFEYKSQKGKDDEEDLIKNPFAALKDWKDKLTSGEH